MPFYKLASFLLLVFKKDKRVKVWRKCKKLLILVNTLCSIFLVKKGKSLFKDILLIKKPLKCITAMFAF